MNNHIFIDSNIWILDYSNITIAISKSISLIYEDIDVSCQAYTDSI